ncbi:hypothetical protein HID58_085883 [Brassica napus]|uniref:Uncharacterized protein n=1 Tax=Brassica napus TaxID=3708 RepID=A0ABQ7XQT0_BRANA|nr:hypothetical protein HID58_085883 [Brassica napus]
MIRYMIKWLIVIYGHLGPTPSHSILRNSLQVGETLPIKRHNVKRGGELIGVDMLLLDSKATLMPGSSPSHHLQTALKGGFYAALMSLGMLYHSIATWTASISPTIEKRRLFLNATSGRQLYFDKETNAEETYFTSKYLAGLSRHWEHIISFTAEGLIQG